jgi:hypothetical protein
MSNSSLDVVSFNSGTAFCSTKHAIIPAAKNVTTSISNKYAAVEATCKLTKKRRKDTNHSQILLLILSCSADGFIQGPCYERPMATTSPQNYCNTQLLSKFKAFTFILVNDHISILVFLLIYE